MNWLKKLLKLLHSKLWLDWSQKLTSTFSTTCFPNEHTFVEQVIGTLSIASYLE